MSEQYEGMPLGQVPLAILVGSAEEGVRRVAEHLEGDGERVLDTDLAALIADVRIRLWAARARLSDIPIW